MWKAPSPDMSCRSPTSSYWQNLSSHLLGFWTNERERERSNWHLKSVTLAYKSSISNKYQETGYKIVTGWYRTPVILHHMYSSMPENCCIVGREGVIWYMCFGFVQHFKPFRNRFTDRPIPYTRAFFLLFHTSVPLKAYQKSSVRHFLKAAQSCIPAL